MLSVGDPTVAVGNPGASESSFFAKDRLLLIDNYFSVLCYLTAGIESAITEVLPVRSVTDVFTVMNKRVLQ